MPTDLNPLPSVNLFASQALTVSGGDTPSATSSKIKTSTNQKLHFYCGNAGASTSVTITIYGSPSSSSTLKEVLAVFTLGASGSGLEFAGGFLLKEAIPAFLYAIATNSDASHTASITLTVDRYQ
jgi:membrane-bound inhibitor of C-type lysozyme